MSEPKKSVIGIDLYGVMGLPVKDGDMPTPQFAIAWDSSLITPEQYAELVEIIGDFVRANGGAGVRRVSDSTIVAEQAGEAGT